MLGHVSDRSKAVVCTTFSRVL